MPDISMCDAAACPWSGRCYRHAASGTTPSAGRQTYFAQAPGRPLIRARGWACGEFLAGGVRAGATRHPQAEETLP